MNNNWPFDQPKNCATFSLRQIFQEGKPILYVSHDEDDHGWQFLSGDEIKTEDAFIVGLEEIVNLDPSVLEIADLEPGWIATRKSISDPWKKEKQN
jgi:hypothetical protein